MDNSLFDQYDDVFGEARQPAPPGRPTPPPPRRAVVDQEAATPGQQQQHHNQRTSSMCVMRDGQQHRGAPKRIKVLTANEDGVVEISDTDRPAVICLDFAGSLTELEEPMPVPRHMRAPAPAAPPPAPSPAPVPQRAAISSTPYQIEALGATKHSVTELSATGHLYTRLTLVGPEPASFSLFDSRLQPRPTVEVETLALTYRDGDGKAGVMTGTVDYAQRVALDPAVLATLTFPVFLESYDV